MAPPIQPGPVPPWRQILADLRGKIESGEYPPGSRLPSIRDFTEIYGVAHTTVRHALRVLAEEGAVVTSPMGTYVRE